MALGPGEHDVRKLQATGGSTFTLSLPKPWVLDNNLAPRDSLRVDWRPSGALRITPLDILQTLEKHTSFNYEKLPMDSLHDHLMGAYISGADVIRISFASKSRGNVGKIVRRFLRSTRGFEIVDEEETYWSLRCLLNAGDMPLHASLNRMYLQVSSLSRDIIGAFEGGEPDFLDDSEERESEVDALLYLIERQVRILLDSHLVATKLNLTRSQAIEYANLARSLERMMDHVYTMAKFVHGNPDFVSGNQEFIPASKLPRWQASLKELMINIRTRDSVRIEVARHELKDLQIELAAYEQAVVDRTKPNQWAAQSMRMSESVRRLCAYSRDFGESLLNMKISAETRDVRK
jgi:phosphate uptake regulator